MAGHPQENSWTQQENGYAQSGPDYGPVYEQQDAPGHYPQQGQVYEEQPGAYEQQHPYAQSQGIDPAQQATVYDQQAFEQAQYHAQAQAYAQQQAQAQQEQAQQAQPRPEWEQWQLPPREQQRQAPPALAKTASHGRSFLGALFDFSFTSFVTPKIIKALYVLATAWTVLLAVAVFLAGLHNFHTAGALVALIIVDPLLILVSLGVFRVMLEFFMVVFRIQEDLRSVHDRAAEMAAASRGEGPGAAGVPGQNGS
ncbi:MAG: DUF4282 domain-containing protein [Nocardiopsaceae bacterium]|nr:DUF4282 domain-containing protein [Nocardiopsaceae bacterium]